MRIALRILAGLYLAVLLVIWWLIYRDAGDNWLVTLFLFSPRWVVAFPLILLVPLTVWKTPRLSVVYLLHVLVILFPIMGMTLGIHAGHRDEVKPTIRILTCNVGGGDPNTAQLLSLVKFYDVDVVLLQECPNAISDPLFARLGWNHRQAANLAIGSPHALSDARVLTRHPKSKFNAIAGIACDLDWRPIAGDFSQGRSVQIVGVHFPTFRPAFERARDFDGKSEVAFQDLRERYNVIVQRTVQASEQHASESEISTLIAGDFNVPVDSDFYRKYWRSRQNALSLAAGGFNHTKFTRFHGIRIDHILADSAWRVVSARVGPSLGGDHRPVIAELQCKSW